MSELGLRVGPFEIAQAAALPGPGRWYEATRVGHTRRGPAGVLVDLLPPDADATSRTALQAAYEALRLLDDPRVPKAVGFFEGTGALVVDAEAGVGLDTAIEAKDHGRLRLPRATALDLAAELTEVLQHAHARGKVHGHLDPRHVRVGSDGRLWVWGLERPGLVPDRPTWRAPEVRRGERPTVATDQWGLGAVLLSLLTGLEPDPDDLESQIGRVRAQHPGAARVLERLLDPEPGRRYESLGPLRQELLSLERQADDFASRRELGAALAALVAADVSVHDEVTAVRIHDEAERTVIEPALPKLPDEPMVVVPPEVPAELPTARRAPTGPAPLAEPSLRADEQDAPRSPLSIPIREPERATGPALTLRLAPSDADERRDDDATQDVVRNADDTTVEMSPPTGPAAWTVPQGAESERDDGASPQTVALALVAAMAVMMVMYLLWRWFT